MVLSLPTQKGLVFKLRPSVFKCVRTVWLSRSSLVKKREKIATTIFQILWRKSSDKKRGRRRYRLPSSLLHVADFVTFNLSFWNCYSPRKRKKKKSEEGQIGIPSWLLPRPKNADLLSPGSVAPKVRVKYRRPKILSPSSLFPELSGMSFHPFPPSLSLRITGGSYCTVVVHTTALSSEFVSFSLSLSPAYLESFPSFLSLSLQQTAQPDRQPSR